MNNRALRSITLLATSGLLVACGTETGNGLATVSVRAGLTSTALAAAGADVAAPAEPPVLRGTDAQGTPLTITAARGYVRELDFLRPGGKEDCGDYKPANTERVKCDGGKFRINGPFAVDLVTRVATPSLDGLEIVADTYKRVDVRFDQARPNDGVVTATDPLANATLVASGTIAYPAGQTTAFEVALSFVDDARFESAEGITVEATAGQDVLLDLDVAKWFASLSITQCIESGDLPIVEGKVVIEDRGNGGCRMLETDLKEAIKTSGRLDRRRK